MNIKQYYDNKIITIFSKESAIYEVEKENIFIIIYGPIELINPFNYKIEIIQLIPEQYKNIITPLPNALIMHNREEFIEYTKLFVNFCGICYEK